MSKYTHALRVVGVLEALSEEADGAVPAPQASDGRGVPLRPVLLSNRAACYMQLQDYPMALADCRDCLRGEGRAYAKGWVRLAQCLAAMGKDRRSLGAAQRVREPAPPPVRSISLAPPPPPLTVSFSLACCRVCASVRTTRSSSRWPPRRRRDCTPRSLRNGPVLLPRARGAAGARPPHRRRRAPTTPRIGHHTRPASSCSACLKRALARTHNNSISPLPPKHCSSVFPLQQAPAADGT